MGIYGEIITNKFFAWVDGSTGQQLLDYTLACRAEMFAARQTATEEPLGLLAAEIAYDRALFHLCAENGIEVAVVETVSPRVTRLCMECELYRAGVDLHALADCARQQSERPLA